MYIADAQRERREDIGFQGLSDDTPDLQDVRKSMTAIRSALELNPKTGYIEGTPPRKQLEDAFESVPRCSAFELADQLLKAQGPLEKLFSYRLALPTRGAMLLILLRKAKECQRQRRDELRRIEAEQRRRDLLIQELRQKLCANLGSLDALILETCRRTGESADQCRKLKSEAHKAREEMRTQGIRCP